MFLQGKESKCEREKGVGGIDGEKGKEAGES